MEAALSILDSSVPSREELDWHMVDKKVGNSRNQDADLMERVVEDQKKEKKLDGVMSKWLNTPQSQTKKSLQNSSSLIKSDLKREDKSKNLMSNWLKRSNSDNTSTFSKYSKSDN